MSGHILAIDQGTTSSRAIIFDPQMRIASSAQTEITQHFPQTGWVEHDASEIWDTVLSTARDALTMTTVVHHEDRLTVFIMRNKLTTNSSRGI